MSNNLHFHPDGIVYVRIAAGTYADSIANFTLDYGQGVSLPPGCSELYYEPGVRHTAVTQTGHTQLPLVWADGDQVISEIQRLLDAKQAREHPVPTLDDLRTAKIASINTACAAEITAGFPSSARGAAHTYDSAQEDQLNLIGAVALASDVPYTCTDAAGNKAALTHTAAQIKQVMADGAAIKITALAKARALKVQALAAEAASELDAIQW